MKTVVLVRHGKAEEYTAAKSDIDRRLTRRGKDDATVVGERLRARGCMPTLIIASPAPRAWKTACIMADALGYKKKKVREFPELYEQEPDVVARLVGSLKDKHDTVMIVGHNPAMEDAARLFVPGFNGRVAHLPTAGCVTITFDAGRWADVAEVMGTLAAYDAPDAGSDTASMVTERLVSAVTDVLYTIDADAADTAAGRITEACDGIAAAFFSAREKNRA